MIVTFTKKEKLTNARNLIQKELKAPLTHYQTMMHFDALKIYSCGKNSEKRMVGCIGVLCHFNSYGHIMAVNDAHVFPGFLTPVPTQLFFPKPPTTFLTCFCRGERRKYAGKKIRLNRGSNSQPPGHESDTLTTKPPRRGLKKGEIT